MPPKKPTAIVPVEQLETRIHLIRGVRVMLDFDLAELYGVPTSALNQAVIRNAERFPDDFAFLLAPHEVAALISQIVISKKGRGGRQKPPRAFTEQGVSMLSVVLRSPTAIRVSIEIMRTFIRMRRLFATPGELVAQVQKLAEIVQLHDHQIQAINDALQRMLEVPESPKGRFGFPLPEPTPEERI